MDIKINATTALYLSVFALEPAMEDLTKKSEELDKLKKASNTLDPSKNHYRDVLESFKKLNIQINQELQELDNLMQAELKAYNSKTQQQ